MSDTIGSGGWVLCAWSVHVHVLFDSLYCRSVVVVQDLCTQCGVVELHSIDMCLLFMMCVQSVHVYVLWWVIVVVWLLCGGSGEGRLVGTIVGDGGVGGVGGGRFVDGFVSGVAGGGGWVVAEGDIVVLFGWSLHVFF